jgi:DivIVA domain-containing protein
MKVPTERDEGMPLERQSIEKKDFPLSRRGYDPAAVDSHLASVADRVESDRPERESLASTAGEQVRMIVAAAESMAAELRKQAEEEVHAATERAERDAKGVRSNAKREAEQYLSELRQATAKLIEGVKPIEAELGSVLASVRASGERVQGGLAELELGVAELSAIGRARVESNGVDATPAPTAKGDKLLDEIYANVGQENA